MFLLRGVLVSAALTTSNKPEVIVRNNKQQTTKNEQGVITNSVSVQDEVVANSWSASGCYYVRGCYVPGAGINLSCM